MIKHERDLVVQSELLKYYEQIVDPLSTLFCFFYGMIYSVIFPVWKVLYE